MNAHSIPIDFSIGSRRLFSVGRKLGNWAFALEDVLGFSPADLTPPKPGRDGLRVLSAPQGALPAIIACFPHHLIGGRQDYRRHYVDMRGGNYEDYLGGFSAKTRSTLRRKARKLDKETGGYQVTEYRSSSEIERFLNAALPLSQRTYQARLLGSGLPQTPAAKRQMLEAAEDGMMRAFLLSAGGTPIAYLSLPIVGDTLIYEYLGYDPEWSSLSAGTVLQLEALERLFAEQRFAYFDFTEGEGPQKAMFGTGHADCASFLLLDPTLANRALIGARGTFDAAVEGGKDLAKRTGTLGKLRAALKS